jgi:hypothetical protein
MSDKPRDGARDGDRVREGGDRIREGSDRVREGGDRVREGGDRLAAPATLDTAGAGTFVRFERGVLVLSDDANDKDLRIGITDLTKISIDGRPGTLRELRPGIAVKASTANGVTTLEATRPRWMKAAGLAPGYREAAERRPADLDRTRVDGDRPRADGERPKLDGDRPRADPVRPRGDGERPRDGDAPRPGGDPFKGDLRKGVDRPRDEGEPRRDGEPRAGDDPRSRDAARVSPIRGVLDKVDGTSLVLSVGERGASRVVPTDEQTKVTVNGERATLADVQPGMMIAVKQVDGLTTEVDARSRAQGLR